MAPQAQKQREQRPRGRTGGRPCTSVGCEVSWGLSLEREGGPEGYTWGWELYFVGC